MRKKIKFLLLTISVMAFGALTACGQVAEQKTPARVTATPTPQQVVTATPTPTNTATPTDTPTPTATKAPTNTPTPTIKIEYSGLKEYYADLFPIGVAAPSQALSKNGKYKKNIIADYNLITPENETKPDAFLQERDSRLGLPETYTHAVVNFSSCKNAVEFCLENNMKMRLHTLVWHSQTPDWFFTEDYTRTGKLVSREVMLQRMENYIKDVLEYFSSNYPGLLYAVDVVNEAFVGADGDENGVRMKTDGRDNRWYYTVGPDYVYQAFLFARRYAPADLPLFYNDYGCSGKYKQMIKNLAQAKEEGLIDGIGMQSHLSTSDSIGGAYYLAMKAFLKEGYQVQVTELDIAIPSGDPSESNLRTQARKYKVLFEKLIELKSKGYEITGVTLWGLSDRMSWISDKYALLYDSQMNPKPAYFGVLQDPSIASID